MSHEQLITSMRGEIRNQTTGDTQRVLLELLQHLESAFVTPARDPSQGDNEYRAELQKCRDLCGKLDLNMQRARDIFALREEARAQGRASKETIITRLEAEARTAAARIAELEASLSVAQTLCGRQEREIDQLEDDKSTALTEVEELRRASTGGMDSTETAGPKEAA